MNFLELLICAKAGDNEAAERILTMYQPIVLGTGVNLFPLYGTNCAFFVSYPDYPTIGMVCEKVR